MMEGAPVELHGLAGRFELNGSRGTVTGYNEKKGRFCVRLDDPTLAPDGVLLKRGNLRLVQPTNLGLGEFEPGSTVYDVRGHQLQVISDRAGRVQTASKGVQRDVEKQQLILLANPDGTWAAGYDVIRTSPAIAQIDECHVLARQLSNSAPPELRAQRWTCFAEQSMRSGTPTIEGLVSNPEVAWQAPAGHPSPTNRVCYFALDAVAHHFVLEWGRAVGGWRLVQSYLCHKEHGTGYTAGDWISSGSKCGSVDHAAHCRFGQGQVLTDESAVQVLQLVSKLRQMCDDLVEHTLLPQLGVAPRPEGQQALEAWLKKDLIPNARLWAADQISQAEHCGATLFDAPGMDLTVVLGDATSSDILFVVPRNIHDAINQLYVGFTGEALSAIHYLHMLNCCECDAVRMKPTEEDIKRGMDPSAELVHGWAIRSMMWS